jgi:Fe2+ or Zn2+ uptake regulation protein
VSQEKVLEVLRRHRGRRLSSSDILEEMVKEADITIRSINNSLRCLRELDVIDFEEGDYYNSLVYWFVEKKKRKKD